jgi:hypothetical protein
MTTANHWLATTGIIESIEAQDTTHLAGYFFGTPLAFAKSSAVPGLAATPIVSYTSWAQLKTDLAANPGLYPAGTWLMYGLEKTTASPASEKADPLTALAGFADTAHQHNLKTMLVPGVDLVYVSPSTVHIKPGQTAAQAYISNGGGIPAAGAESDVFLVQNQGDQADTATYAWLLSQAGTQVEGVLMGGLTTDRGDSANVIYAAWQAGAPLCKGFWMNSTAATLSVCIAALNKIRASGG